MDWAGLLSQAVSASFPVNCVSRFISSPSCLATEWTVIVSGAVRLSTRGGLAQRFRLRRMRSLASPCQMQLKWPMPRSIG